MDFNSHARVGRDDDIIVCGRCEDDFNSHARVGRDLCQNFLCGFSGNFNSHARVGRDRLHLQIQTRPRQFQLTRPRGA